MNKYKGFSLIEMAIALAIIGFLVGSLIEPMSLVMDYNKIKSTDEILEQIKESLVSFAIVNNRLPCPAKCSKYNDDKCFGGIYHAKYVGRENNENVEILEVIKPSGDIGGKVETCEITEGYLPWADLGIGKYDAWNRPFHYRVDRYYSAINGIVDSSISGIINSFETNDSLKVTDEQNNFSNLTTIESPLGNSRITAVILSYGKNKKICCEGRIQSKSNEPTGDRTYVLGNNMENDDIVTWVSKYTLMNRLLVARKLYNNEL